MDQLVVLSCFLALRSAECRIVSVGCGAAGVAAVSAGAGGVEDRVAAFSVLQPVNPSKVAISRTVNWVFSRFRLKYLFFKIIFSRKNMWVLALEAILALSLFVFLVWWTLPRKKNKSPEQLDNRDEKNKS